MKKKIAIDLPKLFNPHLQYLPQPNLKRLVWYQEGMIQQTFWEACSSGLPCCWVAHRPMSILVLCLVLWMSVCRSSVSSDPFVPIFLLPTLLTFKDKNRPIIVALILLATLYYYMVTLPLIKVEIPTFSTPNIGLQWYFNMQVLTASDRTLESCSSAFDTFWSCLWLFGF